MRVATRPEAAAFADETSELTAFPVPSIIFTMDFLNDSAGDVDARLETTFDLDVTPSAFAEDGETFLPKILRLLRAA